MIARMQPMSWLVIGLLVMFAGLAGLKISNRRERAAGQVGQPMSTMAVAMVGVSQQQATRTPRPSATPRPTRTLRPTADATAAFFKRLDARQTIAVRTATAEARATQAIATFTPEPPTPTIYPAGYRAPWADKMVKQADGTWMAPKEVVDTAKQQCQEFYNWIPTKDVIFVARPKQEKLVVYRRYVTGERLREWVDFYASEADVDNIVADPSRFAGRVLRIRNFSSDGLKAVRDVEIVNSVVIVVDEITGKRIREYLLPDRINSDLIVYDPSDGRWKEAETLATLPLLNR
jgi:hypothetical protein